MTRFLGYFQSIGNPHNSGMRIFPFKAKEVRVGGIWIKDRNTRIVSPKKQVIGLKDQGGALDDRYGFG